MVGIVYNSLQCTVIQPNKHTIPVCSTSGMHNFALNVFVSTPSCSISKIKKQHQEITTEDGV